MYKVAVIGDRDSIYGFSALGLDIYPVSDTIEAGKQLKLLADGRYAVIYITEALQEQLAEQVNNYRNEKIPAIIPIPGVTGNTGIGILNVKKSVEQAVGSDIIFNSKY